MSDTNPRPGAWARPFTIAGRDRTFRKKEKAVYKSGDVNDIKWLSNITNAFLLVFLFAKNPRLPRAVIDDITREAMNLVELGGEPPDGNLIKRGKDLIAGMISHIVGSVNLSPD
jgi:hypothetical protein